MPSKLLNRHDVGLFFIAVHGMQIEGINHLIVLDTKRRSRWSAAARRTVTHVGFTRDGGYALASIREMDGALAAYDAASFGEMTRSLIMKPAGNCNALNKNTLSAGSGR